MGDDEIIPNGSVHWTISHEEKTQAGGRRRREWNKQGEIKSDGNEPIEVGQGQSHIRGVDRIADADVTQLEVTLRFKTMEELARELSRAIADAEQDGQSKLWVARFNVQSNGANVTEQQASAGPGNRWAQVAVHW